MDPLTITTLTAVVVAASGLVSLLKEVITSYFSRNANLKISIKKSDGSTVVFVSEKEQMSEEQIKQIIDSLKEVDHVESENFPEK